MNLFVGIAIAACSWVLGSIVTMKVAEAYLRTRIAEFDRRLEELKGSHDVLQHDFYNERVNVAREIASLKARH